VPAIRLPTFIGCRTFRRCQLHNSRLCADYRILRRCQWRCSDFHRNLAFDSTVSQVSACALTCLLLSRRLNPDSRRRSYPPAVPATDCQLSSKLSCPAVRQFAFRFASELVSLVVPAILALGSRLRLSSSEFASGQISGLRRTLWLLSSPSDPALSLRLDPSLRDCRRCILRLALLSASSGLPAIRFRLAPSPDPSAHRLLQLPACAAT